MTITKAVEVKNLSKSFKGKLALNEIGFVAHKDEMLALVGASGSGKSTLLRNINGLHLADKGTVSIFEAVLQSQAQYHSRIRRIRSQIGFIFQQFNLVSSLDVLENVLIGNLSQISLSRSLFRQFSQSEKTRALAALERVGILE